MIEIIKIQKRKEGLTFFLLINTMSFIMIKSILLLPCKPLTEPPAPLPGETLHPSAPVPAPQWELEWLPTLNPACITWNEDVMNQERKHILHVEFLFFYYCFIVVIFSQKETDVRKKKTPKTSKIKPSLLWLVSQKRSPFLSVSF